MLVGKSFDKEVKEGDLIGHIGSDKLLAERVIFRGGYDNKLIFLQREYDKGGKGPITGPHDIEDLVTYGFVEII